jgi:hypothetical protein
MSRSKAQRSTSSSDRTLARPWCAEPSGGFRAPFGTSRRGRANLRYTGALAPMAKLVDATDLKQLSGSRGNALPDPVKVGETPGMSRGNAEPIRTV